MTFLSLWGKENFNNFLWIVAEYPNIEIRKMGKIKYSKFEALHLRYFLPKVILNLRTVKPHIKVEETEGGERRVTNLDKITDIFVRHYLLVIWRPFNGGNKKVFTDLELWWRVQVVELGLGLQSVLQSLQKLLLEAVDFLNVSEQSVYFCVRQKCFLF